MQAKILDLIGNNLMLHTAWEITQFYRGELFTYVDLILSEITYSKTELFPIVTFLSKVVELITTWLKMFPSLKPAYKRALADPALFYTDREAALALCLPELAYTLRRLFGDDVRCARFYQKHSVTPPEFKLGDSEFAAKRSTVSRT
jgi:hypothetical protein